MQTRVFRREDGTIDHFITLIEDITARREAEESLRNREYQLRNVLDTNPSIIFVKDRDSKILLGNEALARFYGIPLQQIVGTLHTDLHARLGMSPQEIAQWLADDRAAIDTGITQMFEERATWKDGSVHWYHTTKLQLALPGGQPGVLVVSEDITERKQAQEALRASEERLRLAQQVAQVGTFERNVQTGLATWTPELEVMYGLPPGGFLGTHAAWENLVYCDDRAEAIRQWEKALETGEPVEGEWRVVWPDGSVHWLAGRWQAIKDESGKPLRIVGVNIDITARKVAEEALERERQTLWHMLQASDHERQIISYEIHDGLAQYLAAAGMQFQAYDSLRENSPNEAKKAYETALELVRQAHAESRRLINEVRPPVIDETGLETAISHLVHEQRRHGGPKIECHSNVQFTRLPSILENALYRIVQEALTNACKHSKSKEVTVTMAQEGQDVRLEVRDLGIGFDTEAVKEGHFGLEGIRQRVRLLGGRLTIESTPGSGTRIQVVVPILEKPSEE